MDMNIEKVIYQALENLKLNANIQGTWEEHALKGVDGTLELIVNNQVFKYTIEVKNQLRINQLDHFMDLRKRYKHFMVLAPRIYPGLKEEFRKADISYLEGNGNIYFRDGKSVIWIEGNKPLKEDRDIENRAFTKTGLKVVFEFLLNEKLFNLPYRQISEQTGTGLANIANIIAGLKKSGYLIPVNQKEFKLLNKKELIDAWSDAYDSKLKPNLMIGRFRNLNEQDFTHWKSLHLQENKTMWGSEPAADILTNYLRPAELTLYTIESRNELMKQYRLVPDEKGTVVAYKKFWNTEVQGKTVPALLIYADLVNINDRRSLETAKKIYDEYIQN